ncbi:hypothetical protein Tco_0184410 [Tanacetum coccineum]
MPLCMRDQLVKLECIPDSLTMPTINLDSVKNWNGHFFWVDEFVVPANARFSWFFGSNIVKDRAPAPSEYNVEHVNTLIAQASPFLWFPKEFLCWVGISRNYLLNKDTYPRFEYENGEEMDLNAFIRTADPRKVRIVERARAENEGPIVTVAKHRTCRGGDEEDYFRWWSEILNQAAYKDKLLPKRRFSINSRDRDVSSLPTLPFITHPDTSPWREGGDLHETLTVPSIANYRSPVRFVVLSDSSHHSGAKSADLEVDSLVRSVVPVMTKATTMTTIAPVVAILADVGKDKSVSHQSVFGSSSSSEKTDRTLSLFTGRSGSGFVARSIHAEEVTDAGLGISFPSGP